MNPDNWPEATWTSDKHIISPGLQMVMGLMLIANFFLGLALVSVLIGGIKGLVTTLLTFCILFTFADITIHFKTLDIRKNRWTIKIGNTVEAKSPTPPN